MKKVILAALVIFLHAGISSISAATTSTFDYGPVIKALEKLVIIGNGSGSTSTQQTPPNSQQPGNNNQPTQVPVGQTTPGKTQPTAAPPQPGNTNIIVWARRINGVLERRTWNYFNRQPTDISNGSYAAAKRTGDSIYNLYWCTNIIIDAYNLAGQGMGLNLNHQSVLMMRRHFASGGFRYLDYRSQRNTIRNVRAGDAIIMQTVFDQHLKGGGQHVALVNTISLDDRCDGYIDAIQSNGNNKTQRYPVDNCTITYSAFPVVAFAGK